MNIYTLIAGKDPNWGEDPLFPKTFTYFSKAACEEVPPPPKEKEKPRPFPLIQRIQSDLMPIIPEPPKEEPPVYTFYPDPTSADIPEEMLMRTRSAPAGSEDAKNGREIKIPCIGFGFFRRPIDASQEWLEKTFRPRMDELPTWVAEQFNLFELAGLSPESPNKPHEQEDTSGDCNPLESSCCQYTEISDDFGKVTKVYRGFHASPTSGETKHVRFHSAPSSASLSSGPHSRRTIQNKTRRSFLTQPEPPTKKGRFEICKGKPVPPMQKKCLKLLEQGIGNDGSAVASDDEDFWEDEEPKGNKNLVRPLVKAQDVRMPNARQQGPVQITEVRVGVSERKRTSRRSTGGKGPPIILRRAESGDKVPRIKIKQQQHANVAPVSPAACTRVEDLKPLSISNESEEERKREEELAALRYDEETLKNSGSTTHTSVGRSASTVKDHFKQSMGRGRAANVNISCSKNEDERS
ncbi:MAG: hypothetical protein Q9227_008578 [Pyrenula ochraceoflavens]